MKKPGAIFLASVIILIGYSCTVPENTTDNTSPEQEQETDLFTEEITSAIPEWFQANISSKADSAAFYGYAHTISADSLEAAEYAKHTAEKYLRFEIDSHLERARRQMEENGGQAASTEFIIRLRKTISDIPLSQTSNIDLEHNVQEEGLHEIYVRYTFPANSLLPVLQGQISNRDFLENMQELLSGKV